MDSIMNRQLGGDETVEGGMRVMWVTQEYVSEGHCFILALPLSILRSGCNEMNRSAISCLCIPQWKEISEIMNKIYSVSLVLSQPGI